MTETTLCLPCALALRPPVTEPPHHCPGQVRLVSGTGQVRVVLCECRICWPDRAKEQPPRQPLEQSPQQPARQPLEQSPQQPARQPLEQSPQQPARQSPEQPPEQSIDRSAGSSADLSGEPLDDLGVRQQPEGGTG
ncbi:hypothetical protein C6361_17500 [Plantactinospora sp. BC1]|uniref:hypothetical protein n=1 Tax=Plantactinospora sp. BC1 TaxID=2108470 RepID=UPI000D170523|nr:hypothetical protein [Plantactinospora sp. BC1]AVT30977.1 hypothetical protein C6361_17500 [Plantactinospora sp. BC1]